MARLGEVSQGYPGRHPYPPSPEAAHEVSLRRLLQVASLTPAQGVAIARGVLEALSHEPAGGLPAGLLSPDRVQVGTDGQIRLSGQAMTSMPGTVSLSGLLGDLARADGQPPPLAASPGADYLAALQAAAGRAALPDAGAEQVAALLERAISPSVLAGARTEIARLAAAVLGSRPEPGPPPGTPCDDVQPPVHQADGGPAGDGPPGDGQRAALRAAARRLWPWLAAIVVFVIAVLLEVVFLHGQLAHDVRVLLGHGRPTAAASGPGGPRSAGRAPAAVLPAAVRLPAPPAAGPVTSVSLRPLRPCAAAAICQVRVVVLLSRRARPVALRWGLEVVDRCTGTRRTERAPAVMAGPRSTAVYAVGSVALPSARSLAVIAVTSQPGRAAGAPLLVPAGGGTC